MFDTVLNYLNNSEEFDLGVVDDQEEYTPTVDPEQVTLYNDLMNFPWNFQYGPPVKNTRGFPVPYYARKNLFGCVRLPFLDFEQLQRASTEELLPKSLLMEALMVRIASHECPGQAKTNTKRWKWFLQISVFYSIFLAHFCWRNVFSNNEWMNHIKWKNQ